LGWMLCVAADFGVQLHMARALASAPGHARALLRMWLRVRVWSSLGTAVLVTAGVIVGGAPAPYPAAVLLFAGVYILSGLVEFLHYFYRGLGRTDIESSLTLWQRAGTLVCGLA